MNKQICTIPMQIKNDRERQEKEIDLHFFGYSSANPDRCFIL